MKYTCTKCDKELSSKQRLISHMKKCSGLDKLQCELCHKHLKSSQSKYMHKKRKVCERNGSIINSFNHINHSYNTYNHCKINNFDEEFFKTKWENLHEYVEKGFAGIIEMIKFIHFNKEYPENRNISKEIKRDLYISVFKDDEWKKVLAEQAINDLIDHATEPLNDYIMEKLSSKIDSQIKYRFINNIIQDYLRIYNVLEADMSEELQVYLKNPVDEDKREKLKNQCYKKIDELIYNETKVI